MGDDAVRCATVIGGLCPHRGWWNAGGVSVAAAAAAAVREARSHIGFML